MASLLGIPIAMLTDQDIFRGSVDAAFFGDVAVMIARIMNLLLAINGAALNDYSTFGAVDSDLNQPRTILTLAVYGSIALIGSLMLFRRRDVRGAA